MRKDLTYTIFNLDDYEPSFEAILNFEDLKARGLCGMYELYIQEVYPYGVSNFQIDEELIYRYDELLDALKME